MTDANYLTPEGAERLRKELAQLTGAGRDALAKRLRAAIQQGDLSENADYISAKEEQGFMEGRIQELERILKNVVLIEANGQRRETVDVGAHVTIQEDDFPTETYFMVGPQEANPRQGKISHESPIGRALLGHKVGDVVDVETPSGMLKLKIISIE
jgi:transcription elongation factor GreA